MASDAKLAANRQNAVAHKRFCVMFVKKNATRNDNLRGLYQAMNRDRSKVRKFVQKDFANENRISH